MAETSLKEKTAKGLLWGGFSNGIQQLLNLLFGIILARLLDASDYGMIGMLTVFSTIAAALQEGGFISALTNREETRSEDYNAVFWFSTMCGITLYILLFFAAPLIADFYNTPELVLLSRLSFLGFVISSTSIAPRAYLFKHLKIRETTIISISSLIVSGLTGITLAANGFAYWGIALQSITFVATTSVLNFYFSPWKPSLRFNFRPIREMIGFSSKVIITNVFNIINNNLFSILLGKFYSEREVGNFTQANKWNSMGHTLITGMVNGIAQPVLRNVSEDRVRQLAIFRKLLRFTAFVSFPAMLGLSLIAKEFIVITITEKWLPSASILQILCIWGAFIPIINLFSNLIISRGHSSVYMWNTICLSVLQLIALCTMYPYGLEWMLRIFVLINIGWLLVWFVFVRKEIGLTLKQMLTDISPYLILSGVLTVGAYYMTQSIGNPYLGITVKVVFVTVFYAFILWKMKSVIFHEAINFILKRKR